MKKVLIIAALGVFVLSSCKKVWTCECSTTTNGVTSSASVNSTKMKKKDAKAWCDTGDGSYYGTTVNCEIK